MKTALPCCVAVCFSTAMAAQMNVASIMENQVQETMRSIEAKCTDLPSHSSQKLRSLLSDVSRGTAQPNGDRIRDTVTRFIDAFKNSDEWMDSVTVCIERM
ncbi:hypothetical protein G6O67_007626 [Ophiocordyceps sinensis]|uniref:Secreted protein n=1 Tax=Ophiocordyceps sinensis TaxID=72228 RepID=A0A8H4LUK5_9HYPO|nr:hypothetical protein G6O67_007626 [Ophiocordyceps sinensis]